ncbi:MAG TPA: SDR family NAD(P)-dependent oxidoreductase, partial [Syntrophaceticus sp.]|nr:SDR family NAD(P)-dependent oxidoreductase [Syntrophaceticus sp.]
MKEEVALITGSARGIGRAIALRLGREDYKVVVSDLAAGESCEQVVQEIRNSGGIAIAISSDVTVPVQVKEMINQVIDT